MGVECFLPDRSGKGGDSQQTLASGQLATIPGEGRPYMTGSRDLAPLFVRKGADPARTAAAVGRNPARIRSILEGLDAKEARTRYGCAKALRIISEKQPAVLYPHFDFFIDLLGSDNKILRWNSAGILADLAPVDSKRKFDQIFDSYFAPISGPVMITAANLIGAAARIAEARPELAGRIAAELTRVEKAEYQTPECRNIALGHAIQSFDRFFHLIKDKEPVIRLIKRQLENSRPATRKKAERFLRKHREEID
jgi:hypothetical protein